MHSSTAGTGGASAPLPPPTPFGKGGPSPRGHTQPTAPSTASSAPGARGSSTVVDHSPFAFNKEKLDETDERCRGEEEKDDAADVFTVEAYYPVFVSTWTRETGMCSICRNLVEGPCIICQTSAAAAQTCHMCWGACGHAFHDHCIQRWLKSRQVCPLDNTPWINKPGWSDAHHGLQLFPDEEAEEEAGEG